MLTGTGLLDYITFDSITPPGADPLHLPGFTFQRYFSPNSFYAHTCSFDPERSERVRWKCFTRRGSPKAFPILTANFDNPVYGIEFETYYDIYTPPDIKLPIDDLVIHSYKVLLFDAEYNLLKTEDPAYLTFLNMP